MALSNAAQIGLGAVAAGAVAVAVVAIAPLFAPVPDVLPTSAVPVAVAQPVTQDAAPAPTVMTPTVPQLDTLRVDPDGSAVFAGRADADTAVDIMLDGAAVTQVQSDASGAFVAIVQLPFSEQSQAMSLRADPQGAATASVETYLIAPFEAPPQPVLDIPVPTRNGGQSVVRDIPVPKPRPAAAPTIIVDSPEGVRVVQNGPQVLSQVALDSITYDPSGDVLIAGRAAGQGFVQVYLDNQPVTTSRIVEDGGWRTDLPDVDTGIYTLRIDEIDAAGTVVSRIETPFQREDPNVVASALANETAAPAFQVAMTTVQPGSTLWAIARDQMGSGVMYVEVFAANQDRIRDPDLIYPGQVFRMPQTDQ